MSNEYNALHDNLKLRVDATIVSLFRNNDRADNGTFIDGFRNMVQETGKQQNLTPEKAYTKVLGDLRDGLAVNAAKLTPLKSENITWDRMELKNVLTMSVKSLVVGDVASYENRSPKHYHDATNLGQSTLNIDGAKPPEVTQAVYYLNHVSTQMHHDNLARMYEPEVVAATAKLKNGLSDYRNAEMLKDAIEAVNGMNGVSYHTSIGGSAQNVAETAVRKDLNTKLSNVSYDQGLVDGIVKAALPIAAHDGKGNDSWKR